MEYAFLIYTREDRIANMSAEQAAAAVNANYDIVEDATARGVFRGVQRLHPPSASTTARRTDGKLTFSDGPFAETKEVLGGFYLIDCKDESEARYWAGRLTQTGCSTAVEFRPVAEFGSRAQFAEALKESLSKA
ncbi:MAG: hypothetical protein JO270_11700 [Acidobacteriaceae bacterium]|nr:hypothetical protein [Acidobacteriaceae bacterium]